MPLEHLWLFCSITLLVSASPGPVMLACMIDGGRYGLGRTLYTMLGVTLGNLSLLLLSAFGLSLLLSQSPWAYHFILWIGALYLVYLGVQLFRAAPISLADAAVQVHPQHLLRTAYIIAVTNPKGLIYFGALFPQFISVQDATAPQFVLLASLFLVIDFFMMCAYAMGGRSITHWLKQPRHQRGFNRIAGAVLILAGALLLFSKY